MTTISSSCHSQFQLDGFSCHHRLILLACLFPIFGRALDAADLSLWMGCSVLQEPDWQHTGAQLQANSKLTPRWYVKFSEKFYKSSELYIQEKNNSFHLQGLSSCASGNSRKLHCKQYDKHCIISCLYAKWYKLRQRDTHTHTKTNYILKLPLWREGKWLQPLLVAMQY